MSQQAAEEVIRQGRKALLAGWVVEEVAAALPERHMQVGAIAGEALDRLGIKAHAAAVLLRQGGGHHLEEGVAVGGGEGIGEGPVQLELAIGILVIGLIGPPAQLLHGADQFADQRIAPHQAQLVVAGLRLAIEAVGHTALLGIEQEELRLHTAAELEAEGLGPLQLLLEHPPRRLLERLTLHHQIGGHPGHFPLPGQHHQAGRIGQGQHIGIGRGEMQPGREARKARPAFRQGRHGRSRHQLGPLHAEQVGEGEEHMAQATVGNDVGQVVHREVLEILGLWRVGGRAAPWAGAGGERNPGGCMGGGDLGLNGAAARSAWAESQLRNRKEGAESVEKTMLPEDLSLQRLRSSSTTARSWACSAGAWRGLPARWPRSDSSTWKVAPGIRAASWAQSAGGK